MWARLTGRREGCEQRRCTIAACVGTLDDGAGGLLLDFVFFNRMILFNAPFFVWVSCACGVCYVICCVVYWHFLTARNSYCSVLSFGGCLEFLCVVLCDTG